MQNLTMIMAAIALSRKTSLVYLMAAVLAVASSGIEAANIYSTSFESSQGYVLGGLNGQDDWQADTSSGDCVVQSSVSSSGSRAVQIVSDGGFTSRSALHLGAIRQVSIPTETQPLVTISQDMRINSLDEAVDFRTFQAANWHES